MYHDVHIDGTNLDAPRSSTLYHVSAAQFDSHLNAIARSGLEVTTVGSFMTRDAGHRDSVVLTFDDGWSGAFTVAAPMLAARGWRATFFVTRDFIGRRGFCDPALLAEAARAGMEIGVHGTTHRMLSACSWHETVGEFRDCRQSLESMLGRSVNYASLPGGDSTAVVAAAARQAGISALCGSRPGLNTSTTDRFALRRVAIRTTTTSAAVERYCRFDLTRDQARWLVLRTPRAVLGMKRYSRLRRLLLNEQDGSPNEVFKP
jgi:peptidoglycan/xylan/chitin deacetylase (PgdA/CDA1 family)